MEDLEFSIQSSLVFVYICQLNKDHKYHNTNSIRIFLILLLCYNNINMNPSLIQCNCKVWYKINQTYIFTWLGHFLDIYSYSKETSSNL